MRKPELAAAIADKTGLTREKAGEVINAFTDQVSAGSSIQIPASKTVGFKAGKALKDAIR